MFPTPPTGDNRDRCAKYYMKDIISSILKTSEERIRNPFIGTFLISFIALNWKAFLIIFFSTYRIEARINIVENDYNDINTYLLLPLVISAIYVGVLPYIMLLFDKIGHSALKGRKESFLQQKLIDIKGLQSIAEEEVKLENLRADYKEKSDLNRKINNLNNEIQDKIELIENLENENSELKNELSHLNESFKSDREKFNGLENERMSLSKRIKAQEENFKKLQKEKSDLENKINYSAEDFSQFDDRFIDDFVKDVGYLLRKTEYPKNEINDIDLVPYFDENLIEKTFDNTKGTDNYYLTPRGKNLFDQYYSGKMH